MTRVESKMIESDHREYIVRCDCKELWHSTVLGFYYTKYDWTDKDKPVEPDHDLFISQNIQEVGFWERLKNCVRYLFKQRKFWNYGETYLTLNNPDSREQVQSMILFLQEALSISKGDVWNVK